MYTATGAAKFPLPKSNSELGMCRKGFVTVCETKQLISVEAQTISTSSPFLKSTLFSYFNKLEYEQGQSLKSGLRNAKASKFSNSAEVHSQLA
jgi:hypothetical protein